MHCCDAFVSFSPVWLQTSSCLEFGCLLIWHRSCFLVNFPGRSMREVLLHAVTRMNFRPTKTATSRWWEDKREDGQQWVYHISQSYLLPVVISVLVPHHLFINGTFQCQSTHQNFSHFMSWNLLKKFTLRLLLNSWDLAKSFSCTPNTFKAKYVEEISALDAGDHGQSLSPPPQSIYLFIVLFFSHPAILY